MLKLKERERRSIAKEAISRYRGLQPRRWVKFQLTKNGWSENDAEILLKDFYDPK